MTELIELVKDVCECSRVTSIDPNRPLRELQGWDSMRAVNFQMELEAKYSVDLIDVPITGGSSLQEISQVLREKGVCI
jgi:acyl carrier protein